MARKNNAKPAEQANPAKDAAMAEATNGVAEQTVTPPVQGNDDVQNEAPAEGQGQPDAATENNQGDENKGDTQDPEMALHVNGKMLSGELEPICTISPEDMESFSEAVFEAVASLIAGAGFFVRQGGEQTPPFGKDILAASFRQGKGFTAVTADGRKFVLNNGEVNEA